MPHLTFRILDNTWRRKHTSKHETKTHPAKKEKKDAIS